MRIDVHFPAYAWSGGPAAIPGHLADAAAIADEIGVGAVSLMDHFMQMEGFAPVDDPMLEGYTALGYLAAITERVRLRLLVTGVTYRNPAILAKIIATLDTLSSGRAELGIGAAWYEREHRALAIDFPPVPERMDRLEEAVRICRHMWSDDDGPFDGRFHQLTEAICRPRPAHRPGVMIGGDGERRTLRAVAHLADACNINGMAGPDHVARKLAVLDAHCAHADRDPASIERTVLIADDHLADGDLDAATAEIEAFRRVGVDAVIVMPGGDDPVLGVERIAPLIGRVAHR